MRGQGVTTKTVTLYFDSATQRSTKLKAKGPKVKAAASLDAKAAMVDTSGKAWASRVILATLREKLVPTIAAEGASFSLRHDARHGVGDYFFDITKEGIGTRPYGTHL